MSKLWDFPEYRLNRIAVEAHRLNPVNGGGAMKALSAPEWNAVMVAFANDLAENPVVPTKDQAAEICRSVGLMVECFGDITRVESIVTEFQRRMFRDPEPEVPKLNVFEERMNLLTVEVNRLGGIAKATDILKAVKTPEPEAPEEIKDLMGHVNDSHENDEERKIDTVNTNRINGRIIEAYRSGQESKSV